MASYLLGFDRFSLHALLCVAFKPCLCFLERFFDHIHKVQLHLRKGDPEAIGDIGTDGPGSDHCHLLGHRPGGLDEVRILKARIQIFYCHLMSPSNIICC